MFFMHTLISRLQFTFTWFLLSYNSWSVDKRCCKFCTSWKTSTPDESPDPSQVSCARATLWNVHTQKDKKQNWNLIKFSWAFNRVPSSPENSHKNVVFWWRRDPAESPRVFYSYTTPGKSMIYKTGISQQNIHFTTAFSFC